jgi:hypothetical protein
MLNQFNKSLKKCSLKINQNSESKHSDEQFKMGDMVPIKYSYVFLKFKNTKNNSIYL